MPTPVLAFLHTARPNVEMFGQLAAAIDPSVPIRHALLERVLHGAVGSGTVTDVMRQQTEEAIRGLAVEGATLVVCTCSTIGGIAEATEIDGVRVMRIDRAMAEEAVGSGQRIVLAATLPSTVRPTMALLRQVSIEMSRAIDVVELMCAEAWPYFERGDLAGYAEAIARAVEEAVAPDDVVVLAQASMAPAEPLLRARGIAAIASPARGVRAAFKAYRS